MQKFFISIIILSALLISCPVYAKTEYPNVYDYLLNQAFDALKQGDVLQAEDYFKHANVLDPQAQKPLTYLNLIKRYKEGRIDSLDLSGKKKKEVKTFQSTPVETAAPSRQPTFLETLDQSLDFFERSVQPRKVRVPIPASTSSIDPMDSELDRTERSLRTTQIPTVKQVAAHPSTASDQAVIYPHYKPAETVIQKRVIPEQRTTLIDEPQTIYLNSELWSRQPNTKLEIELNRSVVVEGVQIDRFLMITPDFFEIQRIDRDHIIISAIKRGRSFIHIWDETGRWTFDSEVIFPVTPLSPQRLQQSGVEQYSSPFRFSYSSDWSSFYRGFDMPHLERQSLYYNQWLGILGDSPYGTIDSSVNFNKLQETTEASSYTLGLTNGRIGPFKGFSLRAFDASKSFSPLTLPNKNFRGGLLEGITFDDQLGYSAFWGRERATIGTVSAGVIDNKKDSFLEGAKVVLFPKSNHQYSINYTQGYGTERESVLKDRAYSIDTKHRVKDFLFEAEQAYDETDFAKTASLEYLRDAYSFRLTGRDIDDDYSTITGIPSNRGELGGTIAAGYNTPEFSINSNLDTYRDRFLSNADRLYQQNYDWLTSLDLPLTKNSKWDTNLYYIYEPGLLSPRRDTRVSNLYTQLFDVGEGKRMEAFIGNTYQNSRFSFFPTSDFDRISMTGGFRYPILRNLSYYANYEQSWVQEKFTASSSKPSVLNTGINYNRQFGAHWSGNLGFVYRDEEKTEGLHSFLAGEDSISGSLGINYRPTPDLEVYVDSRVRNVWAENRSNAPFNDADIRIGMRSAWDTPVIWSPEGTIYGYIFKDGNVDGKKAKIEQGIPNVKLTIGKKEVVSDGNGQFRGKVRAKRVVVSIDLNSIPSGFILSSPASVEVEINQHQPQRIDFGLTTQSGIYGVVFFDKNENGHLDQDDKFVANVKIVIDNKDAAFSDYSGSYFFSNISPGKHVIELRVNSLPMEYIPVFKIKTEIDLKEGMTYVLNIPLKYKPQSNP